MHPDPVVQDLVDRQAITDTLYRYASAIDRQDYETVRGLFTDDASAKYGEREWMEGGDRIVEWIKANSVDQAWQHHLLSVYHIDIDGDAASALTYHTSHRLRSGDPETATVIVARYHDELRRTGGRWKISRKYMEVGWRGARTSSAG